jgi:glycosyltransferase involved in cell wall biosynthesis
MKIGFLITYFYPTIGGAENNCYYTAKELAKNHEVHVFCSGSENKQEIVDGIHVHRHKEFFRIKYYFAFYPQITKNLLKSDLDVLHIHGFGFLQHDFAISKLKKKNPHLKLVCTPHGPFMALKKYNLLGETFKTLYLPKIKKNARSYDAIIEVNPFQKKWMVEDYKISPDKINFVPNGVNKECFAKISSKGKQIVEKKFNLKNRFVISYLGRIQKYKGLDQVVKTLPNIKKVNDKILFVMMGQDVGDKARLQELATKLGVKENILFTGKVSEEEKLAILDDSQIFIFPSEWEAFGIVVLEAMARKNAIISTKTEGGLYLIEPGKNGFLFDYGKPKQLETQLSKILEDPKLLKKMQETNYKKAPNYLWEKIAIQLENLYKKLLNKTTT